MERASFDKFEREARQIRAGLRCGFGSFVLAVRTSRKQGGDNEMNEIIKNIEAEQLKAKLEEVGAKVELK